MKNKAINGQKVWVHICGILIFGCSLIHVPAQTPSLNAFDPPKRLLWGLLATGGLLFAQLPCCRKSWRYIPWSVNGLLVWMILRTVFREEISRELEVVSHWILPLLLFCCGKVLGAVWEEGDCHCFGTWCVFTAFFQGLLMAGQFAGFDLFFGLTTEEFTYRPARMIGTIGYQNQAVDAVCVCLAGIWMRKRRDIFSIIVFCLSGAIILLAAYRGGLMAYFVATGVCMFISRCRPFHESCSWIRKHTHMVYLPLLIVVFFLLFLPVTRERFMEPFVSFQDSVAVQSRMWFHRVALELWRENVFFGVGPGEFAYRYLDTLADITPMVKTHQLLSVLVFARETHFDLLQFCTEFGLVGLGLMIWIFLEVCRKPNEASKQDPQRVVIYWLLCYMAVSSLLNFSWQTSYSGPMAGLLLGLASTSPSSGKKPSQWERVRSLLPLCLSLATACFWMVHAVWNTMIPKKLHEGSLVSLEQRIPGWNHRHRALLGAAYGVSHQPETALEMLNNASQGYQDIILWNNTARVLLSLGDVNGAVGLYQKWARTGLLYDEALENLSVAYEKASQPLQAAETLAVKLNLWYPESYHSIHRLSVLFLQAHESGKSLHILKKYYGIWREFPSQEKALLWNVMGASYLGQDSREQAATSFLRALELDPDLKSAELNLKNIQL